MASLRADLSINAVERREIALTWYA